MRLYSFIVVFCVAVLGLKAQSEEFYILHPSVGDTIEKVDKLDYSLFPKIDNQSYSHGLIRFKSDSFFLESYLTKQESKWYYLSKEEIVEAQKNIEKINDFYRRQAKEDSEEGSSSIIKRKPNSSATLNASMSEQMKKEARMQIRLREDQRRQDEFRKGIRPSNQLHIEFR